MREVGSGGLYIRARDIVIRVEGIRGFLAGITFVYTAVMTILSILRVFRSKVLLHTSKISIINIYL